MPTDRITRRIRRRDIAWVAIIAFVTSLMMCVLSIDTLQRIADMRQLRAIDEHTAMTIRLIDHLLYETVSAEANVRGYLLTHDKNDLTAYTAVSTAAAVDMAKLASLVEDDNEKSLVLRLQRHLDDSLQAMQSAVQGAGTKSFLKSDAMIAEMGAGLFGLRDKTETRYQIAATNVAMSENRAHLRATISISVAGLTMIFAFIGAYAEGRIRRKITRRMQQERQNAIAANRTKSSFLAYTSHELRTPLNAIIGFSEFMMMEYAGPLSDRQKQYLSDIRGSGLHLQSLIGDILDLTKADAGRIILSEQAVDLTVMVNSCLQLLDGQAQEAGVTLRASLAAGLPSLNADELRCKQIIINTAINALQLTPRYGVVIIETALSPGNEICLTIRNTGPGLLPEDISKVIEPYFRSGIEEPSHKGFGLGLPLARRLAELHDGTLTLTSEIGQGAVVTIVFPARRTLGSTNTLLSHEPGDAEIIQLHPKAAQQL